VNNVKELMVLFVSRMATEQGSQQPGTTTSAGQSKTIGGMQRSAVLSKLPLMCRVVTLVSELTIHTIPKKKTDLVSYKVKESSCPALFD